MKQRILLIVLIISLSVAGKAQLVTVRSEFDVDSILLGEQLRYTISAEADSNVIVTLPSFQDTITSSLEILKEGGIDSLVRDGKTIVSRQYLITSFEPGWNTVPPQAIAFQAGSLQDTVYTPAGLLTVLAPDVDTSQAIKPIKPPLNTPVSFAEILPWALIGYLGFMLSTFIAALIWIYVKKKNHPELFPQKPLEPAHVIAFRDLEQLREDKLPQKAQVKEFYTRLTGIIRNYITRQFGIHAMESTTNEILEAFRIQSPEEKTLLEKLGELLTLADLVKFAKEDPAPQENEQHLDNAYHFVEKTYRMFLPEEEDKPTGNESTINDEPGVEPVKLEEGNG